MSFTLGLFVGFCLGILCMVLLFQARSSDAPIPADSVKPDEQQEAFSYQQSAVGSQEEKHMP